MKKTELQTPNNLPLVANEGQLKMKKALFIDRDGTLIVEPSDEQIDTLEKLEYLPKVFRNLYFIRKNLNYELVIVSNQDGLGTVSYPEDTFWPAQNKMLKAFENEGVVFDDILIDRSFPHENLPSRKPGIGMMSKYLDGSYDLNQSIVIGDRLTDVQLAKNLGSKAILINDGSLEKELEAKGLKESCLLITTDWDEIYACVAAPERTASVKRTTRETDIDISINLDGSGKSNISTGLHFFDHMLEQIGRHSGCDMTIKVKGDLHVDEHHTVEDTAIALGEAFGKAIGDKKELNVTAFISPWMNVWLLLPLISEGDPGWSGMPPSTVKKSGMYLRSYSITFLNHFLMLHVVTSI
jgi:imidazoleglycerol-phosphate dehydratase / histidinol-phosphatase